MELGVDYDSLPGEGKAAKARELMLYLARRRRLAELLKTISRERPAGFDFDLAPAAVEALHAQLPAFEADAAPPRQRADGDHIAQADRGGTAVVGDGNVIGDGNVVIKQQAGEGAVQIGQARDVTIRQHIDRSPGPEADAPPPLPDDLDTLPEPGPLPPGSRLPFGRNALFTGRVTPLLDLAQALLGEGGAATLVTQAIQGLGGVGKTQLAVEFAYRYGRYFAGVHWLNAAEPGGLSAEVAACGAAMRLPGWPDELPAQV
ncbi:MAG: hypothetical protein GY849_08880, partial [Deltaproteobacteria bacterium]|nr:hypothetical protein [Deltaproteobacteria bacterium]